MNTLPNLCATLQMSLLGPFNPYLHLMEETHKLSSPVITSPAYLANRPDLYITISWTRIPPEDFALVITSQDTACILCSPKESYDKSSR